MQNITKCRRKEKEYEISSKNLFGSKFIAQYKKHAGK